MYPALLLRQIAIGFCLTAGLVIPAQAAIKSECDPQGETVTRLDDVANTNGLLKCRAYDQYQIGSITAEATADVEFIAGESILVNGQLQVKKGAIFVLNVELIPWGINDTGATNCTIADEQNLDCPVDGFPDQDGEFGRDLWHYNPTDGHAGFSYTKLDASGKPLPADAQNWRCIRDNVSGLIWEKKTTDGALQDMNHRYTWYSTDPDINGGHPGTQGDATTCKGINTCDTETYATEINDRTLCGKNKWRVATRQELQGIVRSGDLGGDEVEPDLEPAFESHFFPNTNYDKESTVNSKQPGNSYWSSTRLSYSGGSAHYIYFGTGESAHSTTPTVNYLRLVHDAN